MNLPLFGTAGLSDSYAKTGNKNSKGAPAYVHGFGLTAFEYQFGHGVRLSQSTADALRGGAEEYGVTFSAHAPYYISMASMDEEKRMNSLRYISQTATAVRMLGGVRFVVHPGSAGKQTREEAGKKVHDTMQRAQAQLDEDGYGEVIMCPETMGKLNQYGSLEEILTLCKLDKRWTPCIDFGHLNARTQGGLKTKADFAAVLDTIGDMLGDERASRFHVHFSKIEYGPGGEKRHLTFADSVYGPPFEPFLDLVYERGLAPHIISESAGTQAEDAAAMLQYYKRLARKGK